MNASAAAGAEPKIWIIDRNDNVGTVIGADIGAMSSAPVVGAMAARLEVIQPIPYGHKVALQDMPAGAPVIKYGVVIGRLSSDVKTGTHVHVHNLQSLRGRGDLNPAT